MPLIEEKKDPHLDHNVQLTLAFADSKPNNRHLHTKHNKSGIRSVIMQGEMDWMCRFVSTILTGNTAKAVVTGEYFIHFMHIPLTTGISAFSDV